EAVERGELSLAPDRHEHRNVEGLDHRPFNGGQGCRPARRPALCGERRRALLQRGNEGAARCERRRRAATARGQWREQIAGTSVEDGDGRTQQRVESLAHTLREVLQVRRARDLCEQLREPLLECNALREE